MITRYADQEISKIWSDESKLDLWQRTELAVIQAKSNLGKVDKAISENIHTCLKNNPIDIEWWLKREEDVKHDLNAFLDERLRFLPPNLQAYFHEGMASYDTEEPAFLQMIFHSLFEAEHWVDALKETLTTMACRYRYTIMNGRTHGQEAQLQSFGKRCLTWLQSINVTMEHLRRAQNQLRQSKLSGAIGNYGGLDFEVEREALRILGFEPFYGATQIMPRELYAPIAQTLCQLVLTLSKIALDIRLGARSGRPIYQEPFGKKQKGSSAMPHKKNTISCEKIEGMARMAKGFLQMITENIVTWEERAIEQSSVERVAWPDLFHVVMHSIRTMKKVLDGLQVYPDNMMQEIIDSRGCYAAGEAKEFLRHHGASFGITTEDAYRIVQLAAFNVFEPGEWEKALRNEPYKSFREADNGFFCYGRRNEKTEFVSIQDIIRGGTLSVSSQLEADQACVNRWNDLLKQMFKSHSVIVWWDSKVFSPSHLLRGEAVLYKEILGK